MIGRIREEDVHTPTENGAEKLFSVIKDYFIVRYHLARLKLIDKTSHLFALAVIYLATGVFISFFLFFVSYAIAGYLSDLLHAPYAGFLIVGAFYLIIAMFLFIFNRKHFYHRLMDGFIKELMKEQW